MSEKQDRQDDEGSITENDLKLARILAVQKVVPTAIVCFTLCVGFVCVTIGTLRIVEYLKDGDEPWVKVTLAIIGALAAPSGVIAILIKSYRKYVKKHHKRTAFLESQIDPDRTSSDDVQKSDAEASQ